MAGCDVGVRRETERERERERDVRFSQTADGERVTLPRTKYLVPPRPGRPTESNRLESARSDPKPPAQCNDHVPSPLSRRSPPCSHHLALSTALANAGPSRRPSTYSSTCACPTSSAACNRPRLGDLRSWSDLRPPGRRPSCRQAIDAPHPPSAIWNKDKYKRSFLSGYRPSNFTKRLVNGVFSLSVTIVAHNRCSCIDSVANSALQNLRRPDAPR
jgi:hypothetical protein